VIAPALVLLASTFVIPPGQEPLVGRMLGGDPLPGACRFDGASIEREKIVARYACGGGPLTVDLVHVRQAFPAAPRTAQFGLVVTKGDAPPGFTEALVDRVRREEGAWQWRVIEGTSAAPPPEAPAWAPWAVAAALLAVPAAMGAALGALLRRRLGDRPARRRAILAIVSIALAAAPFLVLARRPWVSVYDPLLAVLILASAAAAIAWPVRRAPAPRFAPLISAAIFLASLGAVEAWLRAHPDARPRPPPPDLKFVLGPRDRDHRWAPLFPDEAGGAWFHGYPTHALPSGEGKRRVLHLGDSMLESADVPPGTEATALLEQRRPGEVHYNLGISATGPDVYLAVLRRWADRIEPHELVVHVFPGNDVTDVDRPFPFCDGGPLLDAWLAPRCPTAQWRAPPAMLLGLGPPPFPLRVLARASVLADRLDRAWQERIRSPARAGDLDARILRFAGVVREIVSLAGHRRIPCTVIALPVRREFVYEVPVPRDRVVDALRATGARVIDAAPAFDEARRAHPDRRLYQPAPNNPHFDVDGQALYADFLDREVWGGAPAPPR
jgi:hypothetical protein